MTLIMCECPLAMVWASTSHDTKYPNPLIKKVKHRLLLRGNLTQIWWFLPFFFLFPCFHLIQNGGKGTEKLLGLEILHPFPGLVFPL